MRSAKQELALAALQRERQAWGLVFHEKLKWAVARGDSPEDAVAYAADLADRCLKLGAEKEAEWAALAEKILAEEP